MPIFSQFCHDFAAECYGLLAVGPVVELKFDEINLSKPIQFTLPILLQPKKKAAQVQKPTQTTGDETNVPSTPVAPSQPSQQDMAVQQQQSIFKSMIGEGKSKSFIFQ